MKEYTPKQMAANRLLTAATFAALVILAMMAMLVVNISVDTAFDALLEASLRLRLAPAPSSQLRPRSS